MTWKTAVLTIIYTAVSSALGALIVNGVAPEVFSEPRKLWMILGLSAAKDVWLLMSNVEFKKQIGIFLTNGSAKTEIK
jgi:hypothetical protein